MTRPACSGGSFQIEEEAYDCKTGFGYVLAGG